MAKILILIGAHLCMAPRPQKEAEALASAGHDVTVRGMWFDQQMIERDKKITEGKKWRFDPVVNFAPVKLKGKAQNFRIRLGKKLAASAYQKNGAVSPELFGYGAHAMLASARKSDADLVIVHSEAALWVGTQLLNDQRRVGVDFEDWFSEDLLPEARASRPNDVLKAWERELLEKTTYRLATSRAMASALAAEYGASQPAIVYNVFPWADRKSIDGKSIDHAARTVPSLHWYSQTIGPGRGLEALFRALPLVKSPVEVHLRGRLSPTDRPWFESLVPNEWKNSVHIHETVPNDELLSRIAEHDIGLALETNTIPSRDLTVTNKMFQYMLAGLAVIATNTSGQSEVFQHNSSVGMLIDDSEQSLANAIDTLAGDASRLNAAKAAALKTAEEKFSWEHQSRTVIELAEKALR